MEMMDKLDSLNNGMLNHKKKFQKNIKQNKILILISYVLIFFLSILVYNIYNKYIR